MADLDALLDQAEEDVAQEVSAVLAEVADEFAQQLADATELVAARFSVSRIASMFTARMPRIVRRLLAVAEQAAQQAADDTGGELPSRWEDLPGRYDDGRQLPAAMSTYVTTTEHLLRATGDRLARAACEELAAGVDQGEDIEQLRARLREAFAREGAQLGDVREERIARTEAGRAWNTATLSAARDVMGADKPIVKQWITRRDDRVRHDHKKANGQIRLLDEKFTVGAAHMDFPHDPTAPAGQTVNCRCILKVHPEVRASAFDSQGGPRSGVYGTQVTAAGEHTGAMIALVPSAEDAARLAIDGGEDADELHLTIWYLGEADLFPEHEQASLIDLLREELQNQQPGPVPARIFGVNRWNGNSDEPCWVYAVSDDTGDDRTAASPYLHELRNVASYALRNSELDHEQVADQHSPWVAHVTAAYGDGDLLAELETRLGRITFDRLRIAFAGQYTDIPLGSQQEEEPMPEAAQAATVVAEPITTRAWSTPGDTAIAFENEETGDGRVFAPGSLYWDRDPLPLQYADEMGMGHDGAELCGAINTVMRDGNRITAAGVLYLNRYAGMDAVMLLEQEAPLGVSVDLDDVDIEFVDKTMDPEDADWLFASAHLARASVLRMEDGSVMLSGASRAEWTASAGGHMARNRFDLQLITGPGGSVDAAAIRSAFAGSGVLTAAAGDPDDPESGLVVHAERAGPHPDPEVLAGVEGAECVALAVLNPRGTFRDDACHDEVTQLGGTWHWPEMV
ncbi:phage minor head protein [Streptomyces sp. NPDC057611]|uniref:phage minor head protein n=1 Tax=Streptomyces sp. NPDC057611 TaxID=3346182 RepID=UPI0036B45144